MILRTPEFWGHKNALNWRSVLMMPFAWLYGLGRKFDVMRSAPEKVGVPVICIGNFTSGGTGKTPTALAVLQLIQKHKLAKAPYFLTRGYGGTMRDAVLASPEKHTAKDIGDEAFLLASYAPTIVSDNRFDGARFAATHGADLIIMDDGFQNNDLYKDLNLIVIDGGYGFGNQRLIPAGPLREPLADGIERADGFIIIGDDAHNAVHLLPADKPLFNAHIQPNMKNIDREKRYFAFAGLGRPKKFLETLESENFTLAGWQEFPDHYPYNERDIERLFENAKALNASLITTEKDMMRIKKLNVKADNIPTLPIDLTFKSPKNITALLKQAL